MKNFTREKMALTNGVSINNRMVKEEDRNMIKMEYIIADEYVEAYNNARQIYNKTKHEGIKQILDEIKYHINNRW